MQDLFFFADTIFWHWIELKWAYPIVFMNTNGSDKYSYSLTILSSLQFNMIIG